MFKLSKKYSIPWFADYRDGWYVNHTKKQQIEKILSKYELFFEKNIISIIINLSFYVYRKFSQLFSNNESFIPMDLIINYLIIN